MSIRSRTDRVRCYASSNLCKGSLTKEHVVSKSILEQIGTLTPTNKGAGAALSSKSGVVRILCEYHNNALSNYDAEASKLISIWKKFTSLDAPITDFEIETVTIDIRKIECWMLKTFFNLVVFQTITNKTINPVIQPNINEMNEYLFNGKPICEPFGVYMLPPNQRIKMDTKKWAFEPLLSEFWSYDPITKIGIKHSAPISLRLSLGMVELVGFFNLTCCDDQQALDTLLKNMKYQLQKNGKYRNQICFYSPISSNKSHPGFNVPRGLVFS